MRVEDVMTKRPNTVRPLSRVRTLFRDRLVEDARGTDDEHETRANASELAAMPPPQ